MPAILNYLLHLVTASALLVAFFIVYTRITPFDEVLLIRQGNRAAALSLGGALLGFAITIGAAIAHTTDYGQFLGWAVGATIVQVLAYLVTTRLLHMAKDQIEADNGAFGILMGTISLAIGILNAACVS